MKNITYLRFCLIFFIILLSNCKDPSEGVVINVNTASLFKSPFLVRFESANPNSAKIGDFPITITGKDAALVQLGTGGTNFKVSQGIIPLALRSEAKPTEKSPIQFIINAEIPGYEPISRNIVITNDSSLVYVIPAYDFVNKVDGTSRLMAETIIKKGTTTSQISLTTTSTSTLAETVSITIPSGTEMRDGNNRIIDTDILRSSIIFYGNSNASLKAALPLGLTSQNALDKTGNFIPFGVNYIPAGIISIDMFAGQNKVYFFSKPIEISQELPSSLINYETKAQVRAGETLPLWISAGAYNTFSLHPTSATVVAGTNGKLIAKYTITSPAFENLSWGHSLSLPPLNRPLEITFKPSHSPFTGGHTIYAINSDNTYIFIMGNYQPQTDFFQLGRMENNTTVFTSVPGKYGYSFPMAPNTSSMRLVIYSHQGKKVGESALFNPNVINGIDIDIDNSPIPITPTEPPKPAEPPKPTGPIEYIKVSANFIGKCTNKNLTTPVNTWVTISNKTDNTSIYIYVKNGTIDNADKSIQLIVGHSYSLSTTYDGQTYNSNSFALAKADQSINTGANNFTAAFTYNAVTNSLELSGVVTQECK